MLLFSLQKKLTLRRSVGLCASGRVRGKKKNNLIRQEAVCLARADSLCVCK